MRAFLCPAVGVSVETCDEQEDLRGELLRGKRELSGNGETPRPT